MAKATPHDLLLDIYHENQRAPRTTPFQTFALGVTALAALVAVRQENLLLAALVFVTAVVIAAATQGRGSRARVRLWLHEYQHRRRLARHRDELHRHVETVIAHTTVGSMHSLPSILQHVDNDLLQKLKPASLTMHVHADRLSVEDTSRRDLPNRVRALVWTVEDVNDRFFCAVIAHMREREATDPLKDSDRKLVAEALRRWDRFLDDLEAFIQTVNPEGNINVSPTFERQGNFQTSPTTPEEGDRCKERVSVAGVRERLAGKRRSAEF